MSNGLFVIKTTFLMTGISGNTNNIQPENYSLGQNFPNPFNPTTNIRFSLKENSLVKLNVINMQGKVVANVINDRRDGGEYEVSFDANRFNISSGTYFYKLEVDNSTNKFSETKKMILIK